MWLTFQNVLEKLCDPNKRNDQNAVSILIVLCHLFNRQYVHPVVTQDDR